MEVTEPGPARAAPVKRRRLRYLVAGGLCAAAVVFLLVGGLSRNIVYFRTATEAVENRSTEAGRFRLMGAVVEGSTEPTPDGVAFRVTDGTTEVRVVHRGDPPELFKDGVPVVCEGRWDGVTFASDKIMIKHGSEYRPPEVDASP